MHPPSAIAAPESYYSTAIYTLVIQPSPRPQHRTTPFSFSRRLHRALVAWRGVACLLLASPAFRRSLLVRADALRSTTPHHYPMVQRRSIPTPAFFYPSPRMLWWRRRASVPRTCHRQVPVILKPPLARSPSNPQLWLSTLPRHTSTAPLSPHAFACWLAPCGVSAGHSCIQAQYYSPASEPPLPITASIQIWCQLTHTRIQYSARRMPSALLPCWLLCPCGGGAACPLRCCFAIRCIHILSATLYHSSTASLPSVQPPMLRMPTSPDDPASTASPHRRRRILCTYLYIMAHASPRPETSLRYRPNAPLQTTRIALARRILGTHTQ